MHELRKELNHYIENLNEYQLRLVLGFIKRLFRIPD